MTIIPADKIAFDERQPVALRPVRSSRVAPAPSPILLAHSHPATHFSRENRSDRKRSRTGNSTRVIRDGREEGRGRATGAASAGRLVGRSGSGNAPSQARVRRMRSRAATNRRRHNLQRDDGECQRCISS